MSSVAESSSKAAIDDNNSLNTQRDSVHSIIPIHKGIVSSPGKASDQQDAERTELQRSAAASVAGLEKPAMMRLVSESKITYNHYLEELKKAWTDIPEITVEYRDIEYCAKVPLGERPKNLLSHALRLVNNLKPQPMLDFHALRPCSGIIVPGTMTLVLAPPGHGKSMLLKALVNRLSHDSNFKGKVRYNGLTHREAKQRGWYVNKMTAFIDQGDVHNHALTVRETFQFAIDHSNADVSILQSPSLTELQQQKADLMIDMLQLTEAKDTIIGNDLHRGVSGGQRKRVTIGEMILSQARLLCLDEITTGLDASAAFEVNQQLKKWTRITNGSVVTALQQPTPNTYELFDNLILLREGAVVYNGPRCEVLSYFSSLGIDAPADQDEADFLVEFLSYPEDAIRKNIEKSLRRVEQSRTDTRSRRHSRTQQSFNVIFHFSTNENDPAKIEQMHVSLTKQLKQIKENTSSIPLTTTALQQAFLKSSYWEKIESELAQLCVNRGVGKGCFAPNNTLLTADPLTLTPSQRFTVAQYRRPFIHSLWWHTFLCVRRQARLMLTNLTFVGPRVTQAIIMGLVLGSLFWNLPSDSFRNRFGLLLFGCLFLCFGNVGEVPIAAEGKQIFYKQADADFFPAICYLVSIVAIHVIIAIPETILFSTLLYWMTNFYASAGEFFFFMFCLYCLSLCWSGFYRILSFSLPTAANAQQLAGPMTAMTVIFAGFLITEDKIPNWLIEFFWITPFSWVVRSLALNEYLSPRYDRILSDGTRLGNSYLSQESMRQNAVFKWMGIVDVLGIFVLFNCGCLAALTYKRYPLTTGTKRNAQTEAEEAECAKRQQSREENQHDTAEAATGIKVTIDVNAINEAAAAGLAMPDLERRITASEARRQILKKTLASSALPFEPVDLSFKDLKYTIKVGSGRNATTRNLLSGISGYARAGTCTALMGSSGAGKTTLMDVIAGRKTAGKVSGKILVNGHPKVNAAFNRLCGYVEQNDIHIQECTVREAIQFSAKLRLPATVTDEQREAFVAEILTLLELQDIANRVIGDSNTGLSPGQMKRVTIAVEMASNSPLIFLDEPTSGLDSRSALLVMKVIKRVAQSGRTVICTIHQPSSDIFFHFDRLLLLRSGGRVVYFGDIGDDGDELVGYFQDAPIDKSWKVPIADEQNPASWMLDLLNVQSSKSRVGPKPDYAEIYEHSDLHIENEHEVTAVSTPSAGSQPVHFDSQYAQPISVQFKEVLYRCFQSYWRDVDYNMTRFNVLLFQSIMFGVIFYKISTDDQTGILSKISACFMSIVSTGIINSSSALPILYRNRAVFYRETASFTYNSHVYATAIAIVEIPYILFCMLLFSSPFYWMVGFKANAAYFFQFLLMQWVSGLCFSYFGQALVSSMPNMFVTETVHGLTITFIFLFGGIFISPPAIPAGWKWMYYATWVPKGFLAIASNEFRCEESDVSKCPTLTFTTATGQVTNRVDEFVASLLDVKTDKQEYWRWFGWLCLTLVILRIWASFAIAKIKHINR